MQYELVDIIDKILSKGSDTVHTRELEIIRKALFNNIKKNFTIAIFADKCNLVMSAVQISVTS